MVVVVAAAHRQELDLLLLMRSLELESEFLSRLTHELKLRKLRVRVHPSIEVEVLR